jgi:hypothetical protein
MHAPAEPIPPDQKSCTVLTAIRSGSQPCRVQLQPDPSRNKSVPTLDKRFSYQSYLNRNIHAESADPFPLTNRFQSDCCVLMFAQPKRSHMDIGHRLRSVREAKELSQGDIEKQTGLLRCYISCVENGHTVPGH